MKFSSEIWTRKRCKYAVHLKRKRCLRVSDSVAWLHLKKMILTLSFATAQLFFHGLPRFKLYIGNFITLHVKKKKIKIY